MLTAVVTFSAAAALLVVLPGPDTMVVLRSAVRGGRRRATWTALGGLTGLVIWVSVTALGLAAALRASHDLYLALKIAGAGYLVWLGIRSLCSRGLGRSGMEPAAQARLDPAPVRFGAGYGAGLATNLLNPKIGVLFVALLPGFIPAGHSVAGTSLLLGAIYIAETAVYVAVLIGLTASVQRWLANPRVRRYLDRLVGTVFVGLGVQMVVGP